MEDRERSCAIFVLGRYLLIQRQFNFRGKKRNKLTHLKEQFYISAPWWCLTGSLEDGRRAVVQGADLLPQCPQVLLVRRLMGSKHLLHLPQRLDQLVGGWTVLLNISLGISGRVQNMLFILKTEKMIFNNTVNSFTLFSSCFTV